MYEIGNTSFTLRVPALNKIELEDYSNRLFNEWDSAVSKTLLLEDYSLSLEIEEGSIKGRGKIAVAIGVLYIGIGNYGDFVSGLNTIRDQVTNVGNTLFETALLSSGCDKKNSTVRKSAGVVTKLSALFTKVQKNQLTSDQAMEEARALFGDALNEHPDFIKELQKQFQETPLDPEQLELSGLDSESCEILTNDIMEEEKPPVKRPSPAPLPQRYRVQIWRDSRNDQKQIKITKK